MSTWLILPCRIFNEKLKNKHKLLRQYGRALFFKTRSFFWRTNYKTFMSPLQKSLNRVFNTILHGTPRKLLFMFINILLFHTPGSLVRALTYLMVWSLQKERLIKISCRCCEQNTFMAGTMKPPNIHKRKIAAVCGETREQKKYFVKFIGSHIAPLSFSTCTK